MKKYGKIPLQHWIGKLGMPSVTAYYGVMKILVPKKGETLYVSAAAGAVGQVVAQIAKIQGARVVDSAGSDNKIEYLNSIGSFDALFNYKKVDSLKNVLKQHCPKGIDCYFENVGGEML